MFQEWIQEILNKPDSYKKDCWKYHISGNTVEFSIISGYQKKKSSYRCSVIAVGQVLKALSTSIEQQQLGFHIQSFPSLENPRIVASIRIEKNVSHVKKHNSPVQKKESINFIRESISHVSGQYKLDSKEIATLSSLHFIDEEWSDFTAWFEVYSAHNNPFTWLNLGYWKETIKQEWQDSIPKTEYKIFDHCLAEKEDHSHLKISSKKYLQAVLGVNKEITETV